MSELSDRLSEQIAYATDAIADAFETAWQGGQRRPIAEFVAQADEESRLAVLIELLKIDSEYRFREGERPNVGEYVEMFAELRHADAAVHAELSFHLKCAEQRNPTTASLTSLEDSSPNIPPIHCPHCAGPIQHDTLGNPCPICAECGNEISPEREPVDGQSHRLPRMVGRFRLVELVGTGAFGSVYRAEDPELRRMVAIKYPRATHAATPEDCDRLLHEARSAAVLNHPGIVPVHEISHDGVSPFIVCEYIRGDTLACRLRESSLSFHAAATLVCQVADALHFAHEHGIIHRDIKPSNILLDQSGKPYITDFGLARFASTDAVLTHTEEVAGTPAFMAPEQAQGGPEGIDRRADVYSLGVVLYKLLTGEPPFHGNMKILLQQVINDEPAPPRSLNDNIPRDLESICLKAMSKHRSRRYQTAAEMRDDLANFLMGQPTAARPVTSLERTILWVRRSPTLSALIVVSVLATIGFTVGLAARAHELSIHADQVNKAAREADRLRNRAEAGERQARQISYLSEMKLAYQHWNDRRLGEVTRILERQTQAGKRDGRNQLEWRLLRQAVHGRQQLLGTHSGAATEVAASSDGKTIASVGTDGKLRIWRSRQHSQPRTIDVQNDAIYALAVSPDGSMIAVGSSSDLFDTSQVWLYDTNTCRRVRELQRHDTNIESIRFSHNGRLLASAARSDGIHIWSFDDETLRIIPSRTWHESLQFSPDDTSLAGQRPDSFLTVWDCETLEIVHEFDNTNRPFWLTWSPDNDWIAYTAPPHSKVDFVNAMSGARAASISTGRDVKISALTFTTSANSLLLGFNDGTVARWAVSERDTSAPEVPGRFVIEQPDLPETVMGGAISCFANIDDARTVVTSTDGTVTVINDMDLSPLRDSDPILAHRGVVEVSPDARLLAFGDAQGRLHVRDLSSGSSRFVTEPSGALITDVDFAVSRSMIATACTSGHIVVWSHSENGLAAVTEFESRTPEKDEYPPSQIVFTPDAERLVLADFDEHGLHVRNTRNGDLEMTLGTRFCCTNVAVSPDGSWVATGHDFAYVWDLATGKEVLTFRDGDFVTDLTFTADSRFLITGHRDGTIRVRDMPAGRTCHLLTGHRDSVVDLVVTNDGRTLLSGDERGNVRVWSLIHHEEFGLLHGELPTGTQLQRLSLDPSTGDVYIGFSGTEQHATLLVLPAAPLTD